MLYIIQSYSFSMDGKDKEQYIISLFKNNDITLNHNGEYAVIDYTYITKTYNISIELKTRNNSITAFPTTLFARNKIEYYKNNKSKDRKNLLYIIIGFKSTTYTDIIDEDMDYYYCIYNTEYFNNLDIFYNKYENNKPYYLIPTEYLQPISGLIHKLRYIS